MRHSSTCTSFPVAHTPELFGDVAVCDGALKGDDELVVGTDHALLGLCVVLLAGFGRPQAGTPRRLAFETCTKGINADVPWGGRDGV